MIRAMIARTSNRWPYDKPPHEDATRVEYEDYLGAEKAYTWFIDFKSVEALWAWIMTFEKVVVSQDVERELRGWHGIYDNDNFGYDVYIEIYDDYRE